MFLLNQVKAFKIKCIFTLLMCGSLYNYVDSLNSFKITPTRSGIMTHGKHSGVKVGWNLYDPYIWMWWSDWPEILMNMNSWTNTPSVIQIAGEHTHFIILFYWFDMECPSRNTNHCLTIYISYEHNLIFLIYMIVLTVNEHKKALLKMRCPCAHKY